nr:hypothetical protein [Tanacetum cinerariifolium]
VKRIVHPDNDRTQFIRRRDGLEYFTITLETRNRDRAFTLHVRRDNMYITAISVGRGPIHIFSDFKNDFIENTVDMRFEGNYTCLTKTLGLKAYRLCYRKFQKAVERLISSLLSKNRNTLDWKSSLFTVITVTAEGTRNTIVGYGLANSQNSNTQSGMALLCQVVGTQLGQTQRFLVCPNIYFNPHQIQDIDTEISSQELLMILQDDFASLQDEHRKSKKNAIFWKSTFMIFLALVFLVYVMN